MLSPGAGSRQALALTRPGGAARPPGPTCRWPGWLPSGVPSLLLGFCDALFVCKLEKCVENRTDLGKMRNLFCWIRIAEIYLGKNVVLYISLLFVSVLVCFRLIHLKVV